MLTLSSICTASCCTKKVKATNCQKHASIGFLCRTKDGVSSGQGPSNGMGYERRAIEASRLGNRRDRRIVIGLGGNFGDQFGVLNLAFSRNDNHSASQ